ncbi:cystathionine beta-lyase [Insolitispirillum peregrinum]|uniref:Cystathionine beta-lyase n=1 Tax=Insolitispirillum peregrinum TaxID=80876 RepID=A0A1N7NM22_9PROT|nr:cystathionine beta-lyase [Insolitispirillum peregrinum]SIS99416.1 cystathionine beta-lyase [Insolitispirillum peregrinum]
MKKESRIVHAGLHPDRFEGVVNPPVFRASTVLAPTVAELKARHSQRFDVTYYGRYGTPTTRALEEAVAEIEGGSKAILVSSGLAAISSTLLALLRQGDHLLMVDSAYYPTRAFCDQILVTYGIETTYYDPMIGAGIADLIRPNTRVVFTESPGSQTFEVQDIPAIAEAAHAAGVLVVMDNTWGLLSFQPFEKGVDVSLQAATKYLGGHSDAMLGTIATADRALWERIKNHVCLMGHAVGTEEVYLGLRGVRTLPIRLRQHFEAGLTVARWLESRPEVARVLHPALPGCPGHDLWKRDFTGGCGLFSIELALPASGDLPEAAVNEMLDHYHFFKLGYSWGGFESLVVPATPLRTAAPLPAGTGPIVRYHVGLEDTDDLIADLEQGFDRLKAAVAAL